MAASHTTLHGGGGGGGRHAQLGALIFYSIYCLGFGNSLASATHVRAVIGRSPDITPSGNLGILEIRPLTGPLIVEAAPPFAEVLPVAQKPLKTVKNRS